MDDRLPTFPWPDLCLRMYLSEYEQKNQCFAAYRADTDNGLFERGLVGGSEAETIEDSDNDGDDRSSTPCGAGSCRVHVEVRASLFMIKDVYRWDRGATGFKYGIDWGISNSNAQKQQAHERTMSTSTIITGKKKKKERE